MELMCTRIEFIFTFLFPPRRVKALGKLAATIIQRHYRGYLLRGCHRNLIFELNKNKRTKAAVVIQCLGRRYNSKKEYLAKREKEIAAVIIVQRVRRGLIFVIARVII